MGKKALSKVSQGSGGRVTGRADSGRQVSRPHQRLGGQVGEKWWPGSRGERAMLEARQADWGWQASKQSRPHWRLDRQLGKRWPGRRASGPCWR